MSCCFHRTKNLPPYPRFDHSVTDISTLLAQLQAGASYTPASVATALSKFPDLYRVKLATVKVPQSSQATRRGIQLDQLNRSYDTQLRGGGYEVQFLDGQRRARISSEDLEQKSIFLVSLLHHVRLVPYPSL